ncbi:beta-lactamase family protein [Streptomyces sp. HNM0575]|nr:beta-lactamase family protein [Streptomyces sp. HNM0575]
MDREVAAYVPEFAPRGKDRITVRQLLTHTSGLRPERPFGERRGHEGAPGGRWPFGERPRGGRPVRGRGSGDLLAQLWDDEPVSAPGGAYRYSDLNLIALQQVLERTSGLGLDVLIRDGITGPLGMDATSYGPVPAASAAATEDQRRSWAKADRGMLRGTVHDENAFALGGVAGHAGLFSTASDLAVLCRTLLSGGAYGRARILEPATVKAMLAPPGLGFAVDRPYFMGELAGMREPAGAGEPVGTGEQGFTGEPGGMADAAGRGGPTECGGYGAYGTYGAPAGHCGFTGTSLVLDPATGTFLVLLANTVHPVRRPADNGPRAAAATRLARAARTRAP